MRLAIAIHAQNWARHLSCTVVYPFSIRVLALDAKTSGCPCRFVVCQPLPKKPSRQLAMCPYYDPNVAAAPVSPCRGCTWRQGIECLPRQKKTWGGLQLSNRGMPRPRCFIMSRNLARRYVRKSCTSFASALFIPNPIADSQASLRNQVGMSVMRSLHSSIYSTVFSTFSKQDVYSGPRKLDHDFESNPW